MSERPGIEGEGKHERPDDQFETLLAQIDIARQDQSADSAEEPGQSVTPL
jgi:hypothetical protein